ncbi:esterase-like activity of phytase family protein [Pseudohoeflea suaedae]|uniref:Esterase-like activity of phytase family protein n=2 Tax=Pseudohoeflea suaedae TaxID=877384 RepID=A0A4V3A710_9HYPH|nr:esterase-like activity of phytase family protein [Pseudohoeflea suaedae]
MNGGVCLAAVTAVLLTATAMSASAEPVFNRSASFPVAQNLPDDVDLSTETSSEIIAASEDGMTLVYSDSPLGAIGFVDIADPKAPKAGGSVRVEGEPTSVTVKGGKAFLAVNTSEDYVNTSGQLLTIDMESHEIEASCDLGGQPDSVAAAPDGSFLTVAIENERNEDLDDGKLPQMPAGDLVILPLSEGAVDCGAIMHVDVTGLAEIAPEDPEPEFVDVNSKGEIALTLQENNHIVIVDGKSGEIISHFSAGTVDLDGIDVEKDGKLDFTGSLKGLKREPDTVKWVDDDRIVVANEGDYEGGSRGFTIFTRDGEVAYESGASFEREIVRLGMFPDKRAGKKGVEPEGLAVAEFDGQNYIFVLSERASVMGVYRDTGGDPELVQMLPSGVAPESAVAIPSRGLVATANEADLVEDGAARSHVMVYQLGDGPADFPQIVSADKDGSPIGWGAMSGLTADPEVPGKLYAINDSFYANQPSIFVIDANQTPAVITDVIRVTKDGAPLAGRDQEGIAADGQGGFWIANEGNPEKELFHAIYHVDATGALVEEVAIPEDLNAQQVRFGFEGITLVGEGGDMTLWMAVQREWKDDEKGFVKLVSYKPATGEWGAVSYPLDASEKGWVGLSEIVTHEGAVYVIERDNQIGDAASIKKLYKVAIDELQPAPIGGELPVVSKELVHDFLPDLASLTNGYVVDKLEGFTFDAAGNAFAITDNDGVDDSSGETLFWKIDMTATN